VTINDVLPLKAARCDAIANVKVLGSPDTSKAPTPFRWFRLYSLCGATLFGSHQRHLTPPVWRSLAWFHLLISVCEGWQWSRKQNLCRVGKMQVQFKAICGPKFMSFWDDVADPL